MGSTVTDERDAWELLARGGCEPRGRAASKYNGLVDPAGAEELARRLVGLVGELGPTAILVWEDPEDVLLGHVVGRELSLPVVRAFDADGLVGHSAGLPDRPHAVLVSDAIRDVTVVRAARGLVEQAGGSLVGTVVLVETAELRAAAEDAGRLRSLVRLADATVGEEPDEP